MDYELVCNSTSDKPFGVIWKYDDGFQNVEWFTTSEDREQAIDKWYADAERFFLEQ